ncbi:hypothetical protein CEXT_172561 [Caerostris extrusa]|uniref:Uncharacterized protein n=1 Tax=Caerostris extrusa TaxID=172846 RepID=A0AAV4VIZ2_CAEEX|nr:hypothetical protein CEXT_172561 [Caerostris extrusa]
MDLTPTLLSWKVIISPANNKEELPASHQKRNSQWQTTTAHCSWLSSVMKFMHTTTHYKFYRRQRWSESLYLSKQRLSRYGRATRCR